MVLCYSVTALVRMIRATAVLHEKMLKNILRGPMSFFDTTPIGRIVNRFSQDIESIDLKIPESLETFLECLFGVLSTLVIIIYSTPIFASIIVPLGLIYMAIQVFSVSNYLGIPTKWHVQFDLSLCWSHKGSYALLIRTEICAVWSEHCSSYEPLMAPNLPIEQEREWLNSLGR